jgi:hypothetical protein
MTYTNYRDLFAVSKDVTIKQYTNFHGITAYKIDCNITEFELTDFIETLTILNEDVIYPEGEPHADTIKNVFIREILNDPYDKIYLRWFITIIDKELINPLLLSDFVSFHYNATPYKAEFLEMIEFDVLTAIKKIPHKKRVKKWLNSEKKTFFKKAIPPSVVPNGLPPSVVPNGLPPSVVEPDPIHWALFFSYWRFANRKDISDRKAVIEFCTLFEPLCKSETIRKYYTDSGFSSDKQRKKRQNEIKFIIEQFSILDRNWIELAERDILK